MEQTLPIMVKKAWSLIRVVFFILKKGISKAKLFTDLNLMIKRGKLAGKSLHNLLFHHHHHWATATFHHPAQLSGEYEFSCSNTPQYPLSLFSTKKTLINHHRHHRRLDSPLRPPPPPPADHDNDSNEIFINAAVMKALDMLTTAAAVSPPVGKQLRVTDSPFPVSNGDEDGALVDEAADKFIMSFYSNLKRQG